MDEKKLVRKALKKGVGKALSFARAVGRKEGREAARAEAHSPSALAGPLAAAHAENNQLRSENACLKAKVESAERYEAIRVRQVKEEREREAKIHANVERDRDRFLALLQKHGISAFEEPTAGM